MTRPGKPAPKLAPPILLALAMLVSAAAPALAQSAEELRRIWNDPSAADRARQQDDRARVAAEQAAQQAAQQRAAVEAAQRAIAALPEEDRKRIQGSLAILGFYQGPSDGNLASPESAKAIGDWQKAKSRPPTGKLTQPEVKALHEEAAAKAGIKERLDSDSGIAARRADAAKIVPANVVDRLFEGGRDDVIVLLNEAPAAPNVVRGASGPPSFKNRQATLCALFGWQSSGDFVALIRSELARLGAEKLVPDLARACPEPRPVVDIVLLERHHLFEQAPEKVQPLLGELRDRKLSILAVVAQSDLAAYRARQAEEARRAEEEKRRAEAARKAEEEQRKQATARQADDDRRKQEAARTAADDPVQRRKASEPRAQVMTNALLARLRDYIAGSGPIDEGFGGFERWLEKRKGEGRRVGDMRALVDDFGSGRFQSRGTEAIAVEVYFELEAGGASQTDCLVFSWLEEAPIRRVPAVFSCDQVAALEQWKADNGFRSRWR